MNFKRIDSHHRRGKIPGGKARARMRYFESQRQGAVSGSPLLAARAHVAAMDAVAPATGPAWRPLGPYSTPHGQTYGSGAGSRPPVAGRVSSIAVDPSDPTHILIGSARGGVWESKDTGASWSPRTDSMPSLAIGAIAFTPTNPLIAYAGTGEGDTVLGTNQTFHLLGAGLLRSTDGGTTWKPIAIANDPFNGNAFFDLIVDPRDAAHLLAATAYGLYESNDSGSSWAARRTVPTWSLAMAPVPSAIPEVFAGCVDGIYRSPDGGTTWAQVSPPGVPATTPGNPSQLLVPPFTRIEVCYAPSDANVVYIAATADPQIPDPGDSRLTQPTPYFWRRSSASGPFVAQTPPPGLRTGQSWYDWYAAVAPNDPNVLYLGAIEAYRGVRTADENWVWTDTSSRTGSPSLHSDQHAIAFSPADANVIYAGCDGGIFRSPDAGTTWLPLNKGLCTAEVEFLAQHPQFEDWLLAGLQDNGTIQYQGQSVWYHIGDGDGGDCAINALNSYTCYHTYYNMGIAQSTGGGPWNTWVSNGDLIGPPVTNYDSSLFYPPTDCFGSTVAQAGNNLWISRDDGANWTPVALAVAGGELASAMVIPSADQIFLATNLGQVFRVDFDGEQWNPTALASPVKGFVSDIKIDPTHAQRLYVTVSGLTDPNAGPGGKVFASPNGGASWEDITTGLPEIAANEIEIDPANPATLFLAMDVAVFRSNDSGATWKLFNNGLPNALVKCLAFHAPSRLLRAGTQARGVWEAPVDPVVQAPALLVIRDNEVDSGRLSPSPSGVSDPFNKGAQLSWSQSRDIKVDVAPFVTPALSGVDFVTFCDDRSMIDSGLDFAAGLLGASPKRGSTARVYVQVHNHGISAATNVTVSVFSAPGGASFPDLPSGFWSGFPANTVPASSAWQPVAAPAVLPSIDSGRSQIAGFEWNVPSSAADTTALLAIATAGNDVLATNQLNIAALVQGERRCALTVVSVLNP